MAESMVDYILVSQAEQAQQESLKSAKLKEKKTEMLHDLRRFSNALHADKDELLEQVSS